MIRIRTLLTEQEMASSFLSELRAGNLPERFFYWFPLSVQAWLDICSAGAYKNFTRSFQLISDNAKKIAERINSPKIEVISLGAGQGDKDAMILKELAETGTQVRYSPVDASQSLLEMACSEAERLGVDCRGIKADITDPEHLDIVFKNEKRSIPRLVLLIGNTLGAFDPPNYLKILLEHLSPRDHLLIDGEFHQAKTTMAGYDNPLNRRFAFGPLHGIGIKESDGELIFTNQEDQNLPGLFRLSKYFNPNRNFTVQVSGQNLDLKAHRKISMSHSGKYLPRTFFELFSKENGFQIKGTFNTADDSFSMLLAAARGK